MAFVAEDGTGLVNANSLTTVAFANGYFADRNVGGWAGSDAVKQGALIRATDYVETRFGQKLRGVIQFPSNPQALSFPRLGINADGAVPVGVQKAVAEYALRALAAALAPDPETDASGRAVKRVKNKVGPIETEKEFTDAIGIAAFKPYPAADALMTPYLLQAGVWRA